MDSGYAQLAVLQFLSVFNLASVLCSNHFIKSEEVLGSGAAFAPGGGSAHALIDLKNRQFVLSPLGGGVVQLKASIVITVETEKSPNHVIQHVLVDENSNLPFFNKPRKHKAS